MDRPVGEAKVRDRVLFNFSRQTLHREDKVAVVWRYSSESRLKLWRGTVIDRKSEDRWNVMYDCVPGKLFPFPPVDNRVVIVAVWRKSVRNSRRKRWVNPLSKEPQAVGNAGVARSSKHLARKGVRVCTLNATTLNLKSIDPLGLGKCTRLNEVCHYMITKSIDVLAMQEHRFHDKLVMGKLNQLNYVLKDQKFVIFIDQASAKGYGGLAFITRNLEGCGVTSHTDRILSLLIPTEEPMRLYNVYAPTAVAEANVREQFEESLIRAYDSGKERFKCILGDFNAPLNPSNRYNGGGACQAFKNLLQATDTVSAHAVRPSKRSWTYVFPNGYQKQLDHICVCRRFCSSIIRHKVLLAPFPTPHCAVLCDLKVKWAKRVDAKRKQKRHWRQLRHEVNRTEFCMKIVTAVRANRETLDEVKWEEIVPAALEAAKSIPAHERKFTPQQAVLEDMTTLRDVYQATRMKSAWGALDQQFKDNVEKTIKQECENLTRMFKGNAASAWKYIQNLTGAGRNTLNITGASTQEKLDKVRSYFATLGGDVGTDNDVHLPDAERPSTPIEDGPITLQEVRKAASMIEQGKAPGCDEIPIEAINAMLTDELLSSLILNIIEKIRTTGSCEDIWKTVMQTPIPKKGDLSVLLNWRPICLVNTVVKLAHRVVFNRIVPSVDERMRGNQFGFRKYRSTMGAQACLEEILRKAQKTEEGISLCYVDFSKAFPSISYKAIREALRAFHIPPNLTKMVMAIYDSGVKAFVRTPFGDTTPFDVDTGTLQGDVLAPFIFIMVLDRVLAKTFPTEGAEGIPVVSRIITRTGRLSRLGEYVTDVDYADDLAIAGKNPTELAGMLSRLAKNALEVNLKINVGPKKTAWMHVSKSSGHHADLNVPGIGTIPYVTEYRYLGHNKSMEDRSATIKDRVRLTWAAIHRLRPIWRLEIAVAIKLRLFDALITPVLNYGSGAQVIRQKELHEIDLQVNRMRRFACGLGVYKTNLESLYAGTMKFSVQHKLDRVKLVGHLVRHPSPYTSLIKWDPAPKVKFYDSISGHVARNMGIDVSEIITLGQDREAWRKLAEKFKDSLVPPMRYVKYNHRKWSPALRRVLAIEDLPTQLEEYQWIEEGVGPHVPAGVYHSYTDGSHAEKDKVHGTGYGTMILGEGHVIHTTIAAFVWDEDQTNNLAEARAMRDGVERLIPLQGEVMCHTDSDLTWQWYHTKRRSMRLLKYRGLEHAEEFMALDLAIRNLPMVLCVKVRAHIGNVYNTFADHLAGLGRHVSLWARTQQMEFNKLHVELFAIENAPPENIKCICGSSDWESSHLKDGVLCDLCHRWHHAVCVKVTSQVLKDAPVWLCGRCELRGPVQVILSAEGTLCQQEEMPPSPSIPTFILPNPTTVECGHKCKDKRNCLHTCCKRHL